MLYSNDRQDLRKTYYDVWQKNQTSQALTPLEQQILTVIIEHPEYHAMLEQGINQARDYLPELGETNPFLHLGLHLALREQVTTNRPKGISRLYQALCQKTGSPLDAEHKMMDALIEAMWQAQRTGHPPDEKNYLKQLKKL